MQIVIVGDSAAGKTSLMVRFTQGEFVSSPVATVGVDFATRVLTLPPPDEGETSEGRQLAVQVVRGGWGGWWEEWCEERGLLFGRRR